MMYPPRRAKSRKPLFGTVEVDWRHPLVTGLLGALLINEGGGVIHNLVRANPTGTLGSGDAWTTSICGGRAVSFDGSSAANTKIPLGTDYGNAFASTEAVSVFCRANLLDPTGNHAVAEQTGAGDSVNTGWLLFTNANQWKFRVVSVGNDVSYSSPSSGVQTAMGTYSKATGNITLYTDGILRQTGSIGNLDFTDVSGNLLIGSLGQSGGTYLFPFQGDLDVLFFWNQELPSGAAAWLHAEPYAFLRDKAARYYSVPSLSSQLLPSVFDTVTVSESATVLLASIVPSLFDGVTTTESATVLINPIVPSPFDAVTVTESVTLLLNPLVPSLFDDVTVTELTTLQVGTPSILVFDAVSIQESVSVSAGFRTPRRLLTLGVGA